MSRAKLILTELEDSMDLGALLGDEDADPANDGSVEVVDGDNIDPDAGDEVSEASRKRIVQVRHGNVSKINKLICPPGFRSQGNKCVRMKPAEVLARKLAGIRNSKKTHTASANAKRARSMTKRDQVV